MSDVTDRRAVPRADGRAGGRTTDAFESLFERSRGNGPGGPGPQGPGGLGGPGGPGGPVRSRRRRWLVVLGVLTAVLLVLAGGALFAVRKVVSDIDGSIERFASPFTQIPEAERPKAEPVAAGALNVLLLGSDSRVSAGDPTTWAAGAQRTDAIMVLHVPADRKGAYAVSIPRDSWVDVPGRGKAKVNAAFSYGGPALMVRTVEKLTKLRVDHVAIVDFEGFKTITDLVGGVTVTVPKATKDQRAQFRAGPQRMDGETALNYVRQRYNLPGGDFDRVKRQQNWIRALVKEMRAQGTIRNPVLLNDALRAFSSSLATDEGLTIETMQDLALSLRDLRAGDIAFLTAPVAGTGRSPDGQSIVTLDTARAEGLWTALRRDRVRPWIDENSDDVLGATVR